MTKKLCKDCKFYRKSWIEHLTGAGDRYDICVSPNTTQNLVSGKQNRFCDMLRAERWKELDYSCGTDGRFWEAK
jgi:hypothetical protein